MWFIATVEVGANPLGKLFSRKQAIAFDDSALGVDPLWLDGIEPGAFCGQKARQNPNAFALLLDRAVVLANPGTYHLAHMEGGIIPDQQPSRLPLGLQSRATPLQKLGGDLTHGTTRDKAKRHLTAHRLINPSLLPQHPITREGFGVRIVFLPGLFYKADRMLAVLPGVQAGQRKAAPPHFVQKADGPAWLLARPGDQAVASVFFTWYCRSGLVIQCLARFQLIPNRLRVWRMVSSLTWLTVQPCLTHALATNESVQRPVSKPQSRGGRCSSALKASASTPESAVRKCWGRLEPACRASGPFWLKAWCHGRTVCSSQLRARAMLGTRSPRAEAKRIWLRRNTKASEERKPVSIRCCSSSVNGRTKMGCLMSESIPHSRSPVLRLH